MTDTANAFRRDCPEFGENTVYTDPVIDYWLNIANLMLNAPRWGRLLPVGINLFTAHNIVLERQQIAEAANGLPPGLSTGLINSKSVDKVSIAYDTASGIETDAGHWNLTVYGTRFIKLARMCGAGPIQVGAGSGVADPLSSSNAWPGPDTQPGFTTFGS